MRRVALVLVLAVIAACSAPPGKDAIDAAPPGDGTAATDAPTDAATPTFFVQYADPDHGPFRGGTIATIRGGGFRESDEVWIGGRRV